MALAGAVSGLSDGPDRLVEAWLDAYEASIIRLPGSVAREELRSMLEPVVEALAEGLTVRDGDRRVPAEVSRGSAHLRELEKDLSFMGAQLAAGFSTAFDAAALVLALRDAMVGLAASDAEVVRTRDLFDWFGAITLEGFASGRARAAVERHRELLEESTPVVFVAPDVPAAFPIGTARAHGLHAVFARLALAIARVGARAVIVDASGLRDAGAPPILEALHRYCVHPKIAERVALIVAGLGRAPRREWESVAHAAGVDIAVVDTFADALSRALERSEFRLVRRER